MFRIRHIVVAFALMTGLTSCFTGIESTPAITDKDVRRQQVQVAPEESFLDDIKPTNMSDQLKVGKQWIVTDRKIKLVLDASADNLNIIPGNILTYVGSQPAVTVDGRNVTDIELADSNGNTVYFRTSIDPDRFKDGAAVEIPFAIDLDLIAEVSKRMTGKDFYILSRSRYDMTDNTYNGRKFVKVTIDTVSPGNSVYPVRLSLSEKGEKKFRLYMSTPFQQSMPRRFSTLFSLTNPRDSYPTILPAVWDCIVNGKVMTGMTRNECRLSLGEPDNVDRQTGYSSIREIWTYKDGRYLIFIDGVLESFRT